MKQFYKNNRVFVILMGIVLVCVILMTSLLLVYFYKGNSGDKYGKRLKDIENVVIEDKRLKDIEKELTSVDIVEKAYVNRYGRIIYFDIYFNEGTDLVEAKGKAATVLEKFSAEEIEYYDFQFLIKENIENGFITSGAKNTGSVTIVWNNNNIE